MCKRTLSLSENSNRNRPLLSWIPRFIIPKAGGIPGKEVQSDHSSRMTSKFNKRHLLQPQRTRQESHVCITSQSKKDPRQTKYRPAKDSVLQLNHYNTQTSHRDPEKYPEQLQEAVISCICSVEWQMPKLDFLGPVQLFITASQATKDCPENKTQLQSKVSDFGTVSSL